MGNFTESGTYTVLQGISAPDISTLLVVPGHRYTYRLYSRSGQAAFSLRNDMHYKTSQVATGKGGI